jgi:hypothetical protein
LRAQAPDNLATPCRSGQPAGQSAPRGTRTPNRQIRSPALIARPLAHRPSVLLTSPESCASRPAGVLPSACCAVVLRQESPSTPVWLDTGTRSAAVAARPLVAARYIARRSRNSAPAMARRRVPGLRSRILSSTTGCAPASRLEMGPPRRRRTPGWSVSRSPGRYGRASGGRAVGEAARV